MLQQLIEAKIDGFSDYDASVRTYYRDPLRNIMISAEKFRAKKVSFVHRVAK